MIRSFMVFAPTSPRTSFAMRPSSHGARSSIGPKRSENGYTGIGIRHPTAGCEDENARHAPEAEPQGHSRAGALLRKEPSIGSRHLLARSGPQPTDGAFLCAERSSQKEVP